MKILLSAYACEPNKGSEPGVGWSWAVELARSGHKVWVFTRQNNQGNIEPALQEQEWAKNLHFIYYDLPGWCLTWKKLPFGIYAYYALWQWGIYQKARQLVQSVSFDLVHHVTFVSMRQPSFLGKLELPFIFGPLAGGDWIPAPLQKSFPYSGKIWETMRQMANTWVKFDPLMHASFQQASHILVNSRQTLELIPKQYHDKTSIQLAIGIDPHRKVIAQQDEAKQFNILYVGRLISLKGVHLALQAFSQLHAKHPTARFTIVGSGPEEQWLKNKAAQLQIDQAIKWIPQMEHKELARLYASNDVFLFPSLRDSGGMVVLEALSHGLPVICLDLGGPGVIVNDQCGCLVPTLNRSESDIVDHMATFLHQFAQTPELSIRLKQAALSRAQEFLWGIKIKIIYSKLLNNSKNPSIK